MKDLMEDNQIAILSLTSGEHIITEINTDQSSGIYFCQEPMQIIAQPDVSGKMNIGIAPFMPYADPKGGFAIPLNMAILAIPSDQLLNAYQNALGKIITPPQPKIILG